MRKFAIAMSEVQSDVVQTDAGIEDTLTDAQEVIMDYLRERVGDFLDIDDDNHANAWELRNRAVSKWLTTETQQFKSFYTKRYVWRCEDQGGLVVSATIQEVEA